MLVLSRRADEKIVFPSLKITIHLLRINGQVVRLGIDAPPGIKILRDELADHSPGTEQRSPTHELSNRLSKVALALHLFERQRAAGLHEEAEANLKLAFNWLAQLDQEAVAGLVAGHAPPPTPERRNRLQALLVEDDPNERELLAGLLRMNGCECATACDGAEALRYLASHEQPDVVLLDMRMPGCDGPTALRAIRSLPGLIGLQVFGVSGSSQTEMGVVTGPEGVNGWFPKPLNPGNLWKAIQTCGNSPASQN